MAIVEVYRNNKVKFFVITVDGVEYKWHSHLIFTDNELEISIRKQLYPDANVLVPGTAQVGTAAIEQVGTAQVGTAEIPADPSATPPVEFREASLNYAPASGDYAPAEPASDDFAAAVEDSYRQCQDLAEIETWIVANPSVDPIPWVDTKPMEVVDRGNISDATKTSLDALRTSNPDLAPIVDVLIGGV